MKTEAFENGFESGAEKNRSISSVDRWKGGFWKWWRKKRHFQLVWAIGEDDSVWTGKNKTKTLVWSKIFGFVYFEMKMDTTVNGA